ncbi:aminotransferase class I/II-fold pyridoxal phosphate-dependent enzyme [Streptomyces sp. NPDC002536]
MAAHAKDLPTPAELTAVLAGIADPERRLAAVAAFFPDALNLATAENVLLYPSLKENVFDHLGVLGEKDVRYPGATYGTPQLRSAVTEMLRPVFSRDLEPDDVFGTSGVSAALECLAFALEEGGILRRGDRVLLPAPFWQGFKWCFEQRPGLVCAPVHLRERGLENFELTLEDLKRAYRTQPEPPRLLVLTNPHNPLGVNYDKDLLEAVYTWALTETGMHIISDEMYAHSQIEGADLPFVSALDLDAYQDIEDARERVHVVWGFAKDFGLSGFKAGVVISRSPVVHAAMKGTASTETYAWFSPFDSLKHFVVGRLLTTPAPGKSYALALMDEYKKLLTGAFRQVRGALDEAGIPYVFREGQNPAQFFWLDLRDHLPVSPVLLRPETGPHFPADGQIPAQFTGEARKPGGVALPVVFTDINTAEEWLRWYIATEANVLLLPGQTLSCAEPGYFRLCYTAFETPAVVAAVQRIGVALAPLRP